MWELKKPDRDGIWLWRLPDKKHHGTGVIRVKGDTMDELGSHPTVNNDLDLWWNTGPKVEVFYVEGA